MLGQKILGIVDVPHLVSRFFKTRFPDIPSKKVANPAPRKNPAGPYIESKL